ncbi:hypothetical protein ACFLWV_01280 [Chloroflexota bacterium]
MPEQELVQVATQTSLWQNFTLPVFAAFAGVTMSILISFIAYKVKQCIQNKTARERAWSTIIFEVAENRNHLKWLVQNVFEGELKSLKQKNYSVPILNQYRLRTSAIDIAFSDETIRQIGNLGFQVRLKNTREVCVDFNLSLQHADLLLVVNPWHENLSIVLNDLYSGLRDTANNGRTSLEQLFTDLNSDTMRPSSWKPLDLDELEKQTIEKMRALADKAKRTS